MNQDPDNSSNTVPNRALKWLVIPLAIFLLVEIPLLITHARHAYFKIDGWFAFYAILGLFACGFLVFIGRGLGAVIRRDENHYGTQKDETQPEDLDDRIR